MLARKTLAPLVLFGALMTGALPAYAADVTLRLAHNLSQEHVIAKTFTRLAQRVAELSHDKMEIKIYPNGQMGETKDVIAMMQQGAMDMTKGFYGELEAFEPSYFIFAVPYLFQNDEHLERVLRSRLIDELNERSAKKGFINLAGYGSGTRSFYTNKEIRTPDDVKGLKIRVLPTPTTNRMMELIGAHPVPIPYGETYTAIQQHVIDGAENNITTYVSTRQFEVAKVFSEDRHTVVVDFLTMSKKSWDRLTPDQKAILKKAVDESVTYEQELYRQDVDAAVKRVRAAGNEIIEADPAPFKAAVAPLMAELMADPEKAKWIEAVRAEAK